MNPAAHRRRSWWKALGIASGTFGLVSALALGAQESAAQNKTPSAEQKSEDQGPQGGKQKAGEKPSKEAPAAPGKLELENPEPPQAQKPAGQQPPPGPGKPQLENPPPAAPEKPQAAKPEAPERPTGPPVIEKITFRGNRRIPTGTLRARMFTHEGDVYNENALERDFMALWNTGFLDDIRFESSPGPKGGILLTVFVREKKLIRSIDYKGLSTVQTSDVLDRFKERKVGLSQMSQYDPVVVKRAEVVLQNLLAEHGRQFASVRARTRNIPPNSVALTFIVVEGPKVKVGKIHFQGNTVFSAARLVRAMKLSRPSGAPPWFYWFHKTYDKNKADFDLEQIRELYQDHGYFYALPKEPQVKMINTRHKWPFFFYSWGRGKVVNLTIPIDEGAQYRLGKFVIRGNKLFKQEVLAPILQLKPGDVFSLGKVKKSIENYTKLYGNFGYINFTANPDIDPDRKKRIINLALDFEEDKQFFVHRVEFSGNTKTRDKVIRRELLLDEGSVFSSSFWDLSVLRLNQLGFFDQIKKEDYDIKQNNKAGTVDINLKVKEKGRNSIGFSGGVSGLSGNFVGFNYATNNFLGLGETLSVQVETGTFQKLYSFGFTEPYLFDRPITSGFTIFKSNFKFDQLRQLAATQNINPAALAAGGLGNFTQNFEQDSTGFTVFASYPFRHAFHGFARAGLTYSYTRSSLQAFNSASQAFFEAVNFRGLEGPNALSGITSSQIMPTFLYNTVNDAFNPSAGKFLSASLGISGGILGGNIKTITPSIEAKYFHAVGKRSEKPRVLALHLLASQILGYGGRVPPPFSRFYIGGEEDIRGFDIRTISPIAFFPTTGSVCNLDNSGNRILALSSNGQPTGACGSSTAFPFNTAIFPGGDTQVVTNVEYRVPIVGPVTAAFFVDTGVDFITRGGQLKVSPTSLSTITSQFPGFPIPSQLKLIPGTNFKPRSSVGLEFQVILPVVNAPVRIFYGYNWRRLDEVFMPPQSLPSRSLFPNDATYNQILPFFQGLRLRERKGRVGFTVARTF